ncbi:MAG: type III-B CRISPR module RAMP protein Cmr4 [candidate division WOR-3 bacterium]
MSIERRIIGLYEISEIVLIKAITNLHPGVRRTGEIVDLPVQKDHLGFPIIYASSLKGALKSALWQFSDDRDIVKALFGSEPDDVEKFTSAVAVLDAFTLAFPVRSLEGVYAFATSPVLLKRFNEYLGITGETCEYVEKLSNISIGEGVCETSENAKNLLSIKTLDDKLIINEEISVKCETNCFTEVEELEKLFGIEQGRLILLNDDDALKAIEKSLVRVTRIKIDREKKTAREGALWTEEYIPWGTVFATAFLYSKAKKSEKLQKANDVKQKLHELLSKMGNYLIIGGNETIGRGIVKLEFKEKEV